MRTTKPVRSLAAVAALAILTACGGTASESDASGDPGASEEFPTKRLRIVVPYPAGGGTDIAARGVAPCMEEALGQSVIVENKAGGSGALGTQELLTQPADGYTMEVVLTSNAVVTPLSNDVGYTLEDFRGVGQIAEYPYVLFTSPDSPYSSAQELLEAAQTGATFIAAAPGAASQGTIELERIAAEGLDFTIVPFDGTAGVKTAVVGGNADVGIAVVDEDILAQHEQGTLNVLATVGDERVDYLSDVPAINEFEGFEDLGQGTSYIGLVVPADTPDDVTSTLESTLEQCLQDEQTVERIGEEFVTPEFTDGEALMSSFQAQSEAYAEAAQK
ncbi:tripartite tricarboxylate transporter substrate binding protein [Blastococcus sp. SYSU DS0539]